MEVRKIRPEECIHAKKIETIAFLSGTDFSRAAAEPERFMTNYELKRAVFNDEGKMCSCLTLFPYEFMLNGHRVKTGGIGGVASLPEERHKGHIRALLRFAMEEMHDTGMILSYLYPFSHTYYRKFGYELGYVKFSNTMPFTSLRCFTKNGRVRFFMPGEDASDIINIYNSFIADKNLAMVRSDEHWKRWLGSDPYRTGKYTFIWYDDGGNPKSYIIASSKPREYERADMEVNELVWLDRESLFGILGFLTNFIPKYDKLKVQTPVWMDFWNIIPEPYEVEKGLVTGGMARIIDVEKVLELIPPPEGKGSLTLKVSDSFLEWNNGTFRIEWDDGELEVSRENDEPDLECSIQALSQLSVGFTDIDDYALNDSVKVYGNLKSIKAVFRKKLLFLNDFF